MHEPPGQILPDSPFGKVLTGLARKATVILEIGTWNGGGSTLCLWQGMAKPEQRMWTVEQDEKRRCEAKGRYSDPRITFVHGRTLEVLGQLPPAIDLLLLDGGVEESFREFEALAPSSRVIALDDTNDVKNREAVAELKRLQWRLLSEGSDRNGWAVFERP
jgi:predicted O-methyltransferase YrrM